MNFVSFEIAKKLKEKGFREKVNAYYGKKENIFDVHPSLDMNDSDYRYSAPTISQVLKWLREEKKIAINVEFIPYVWQYKIFDMSFEGRFEPCGITLFSDYEEAAIAGIEYVINNLI